MARGNLLALLSVVLLQAVLCFVTHSSCTARAPALDSRKADDGVLGPAALQEVPGKNVDSFKSGVKQAMITLSGIGLTATRSFADEVGDAAKGDGKTMGRGDVGFISLNETEPTVTDVAFMDIQIGNLEPKRIEINLYGTIVPETVENFKELCRGTKDGIGYKGSEIFRVISSFSIQGGNIGCPTDSPKSRIGRFGKAASTPFLPENFRILHDSPDGGVVSMMKDLTNKGKQDSRFFITMSPRASWADDKYSAFGRVAKGLDFVQSMQVLPTVPPANYPETPITIIDAGIL